MTSPPTLAGLMADPGELVVSCLDCHHNTTMPVAALLPRYAAETPFPEAWSGPATMTAAPAPVRGSKPKPAEFLKPLYFNCLIGMTTTIRASRTIMQPARVGQ